LDLIFCLQVHHIHIHKLEFTIQYNTIQYLYLYFHRDTCSRRYLSKMFSKEPSLKKAFEGSEFCGCPDEHAISGKWPNVPGTFHWSWPRLSFQMKLVLYNAGLPYPLKYET
jgi:hypothetical protein